MKTPSSRARRGFTLVELLVVIAIIAVLAAAGFAAGNAALTKARSVTANAAAMSVQQAVNAFYTEYGSLPAVGNVGSGGGMDSEIETTDGTGVELIRILLGKEQNAGGNNSSMQNTKSIKFLEVKDGKARRDGIVYAADRSTVVGLYDPWGGPYTVVLDTNYDDTLEFALGQRVKLNGRRVAVYSAGPDRQPGTQDDVKTW